MSASNDTKHPTNGHASSRVTTLPTASYPVCQPIPSNLEIQYAMHRSDVDKIAKANGFSAINGKITYTDRFVEIIKGRFRLYFDSYRSKKNLVCVYNTKFNTFVMFTNGEVSINDEDPKRWMLHTKDDVYGLEVLEDNVQHQFTV